MAWQGPHHGNLRERGCTLIHIPHQHPAISSVYLLLHVILKRYSQLVKSTFRVLEIPLQIVAEEHHIGPFLQSQSLRRFKVGYPTIKHLTPKGPRGVFLPKHSKSAISSSRSPNEFFSLFCFFNRRILH
jgi:hypothetical protein